MSTRVLVGLWLAFAFVTWNVVFDRAVAIAAIEFTREQIGLRQQGAPVVFLEDGFSPRVRAAAREAWYYAAAVLAVGCVLTWRARRQSSSRHPRLTEID